MTLALAIRVFVPFALGYFVISIFRPINAVIAPALVTDLSLSPGELGFATSAFFLSAVLFQLPYGILLDRYDPRRLYPIALCTGALGAALTAFADGVAMLALGRALIAIGASASAVTSFKVNSLWFPTERLPFANGLTLAAGGLGLMAGTVPVEMALRFTDWRGVHLVVGAAVVVCAALIAIGAPRTAIQASGMTLSQQVRGLGVIPRSPAFWYAAPLMMVVCGIYGAFASLWAGPWVRDVAGLTGQDAANLLLVLAAAMAASGLATGGVVSLGKRFNLSTTACVVATAIVFLAVQVILCLQWVPAVGFTYIVWALFGFVAPLNFITYAAMKPLFPPEYTGRLNACLTLSWMIGSFLLQNLYGWILDRFPRAGAAYAVEGHQVGTAVMLVLLVLAIVWFQVGSSRIRKRSAAFARSERAI